MKILIEHIVYQPYTGKITGGTERFTYLALQALRHAGHQADLVVPADSIECDHIRSPMPSRLADTRKTLEPWYRFMSEFTDRFDAFLLNHPLTSPVPFGMPVEFLRKCVYINHNGSGGYVTGNMGMRLIAHLKLLRYLGGRTLCLSAKNKADLEGQYSKKGVDVYRHGRFGEAGSRLVGDYEFLGEALFDSNFDQAICPDDLAAPAPAQGYVVSIGRADNEKRLPAAAKAARALGKEHIAIMPTPANEAEDKMQAKVRSLGSEIFLELPHHDVMSVLAGADALILASRNETYCHVAMEAIAHGVPVMALEVPPSMNDFPELLLPWGKPFETTLLEDRVGIQQVVQETYTPKALGHRLARAMSA